VARRQWVVALAPGGRFLLAQDSERVVRLSNLSEESPVGVPLEAMEMVDIPFAFQADGRWLLGAFWDQSTWLWNARLWDVQTARPVGAPLPLPGRPKAAAFRPGGRTAVLVTSDGSLIRWTLPTRLEGDADRTTLWASVLTGEEIGTDDVIRPLDAATWKRYHRQLESATGPSLP
jgi:hypothetical protein